VSRFAAPPSNACLEGREARNLGNFQTALLGSLHPALTGQWRSPRNQGRGRSLRGASRAVRSGGRRLCNRNARATGRAGRVPGHQARGRTHAGASL